MATTNGEDHVHVSNAPITLPDHLIKEISELPKLTKEQCGHLRHFHNLSTQPDGDWSFMGGSSGQDHDEGSFRYQLAFMAYAAGAAHYHRLPALRSVFRSLMDNLIKKMLHPEVWGYWYLTSQSGKRLDRDLVELRKPWADPVCKENVMYSGHLLLMVSLYSMLFDDDHYDEEDSIVFDWSPMWWGMGPERYSYSRSKLQETILKQMEQNGWMGTCCEPNIVFIICNQFPLIATRYNDVRNGTNIIDDILPKYKQAWEQRGGFLSENGLFRRWYAVNQDEVLSSEDISHSAWIMAFMPWNHPFIQTLYPSLAHGFLHPTPDHRLNIHPPSLATAIRHLISSSPEDLDPTSPSTISLAKSSLSSASLPSPTTQLPTFGFVAQWLSEIPGSPALTPLLHHADRFLNPRWHRGGLYYARHPPGWDAEGNYLYMEPYSGNAAIGYARLNVKGGQRGMWERPWGRGEVGVREEVDGEVRGRSWVEGVGLGDGVDFLRGGWCGDGAMVVTLRTWDGLTRIIRFRIDNLGKDRRWGVYIDGRLSGLNEGADEGDEKGGMEIEVEVGGEEVDIVVVDIDRLLLMEAQ